MRKHESFMRKEKAYIPIKTIERAITDTVSQKNQKRDVGENGLPCNRKK